MTNEDFEVLETYAIKDSVLNGTKPLKYILSLLGCPNWLMKWVALILTFIKEEKNQYIDSVYQSKKETLEAQLRKTLDDESIEHLVSKNIV